MLDVTPTDHMVRDTRWGSWRGPHGLTFRPLTAVPNYNRYRARRPMSS